VVLGTPAGPITGQQRDLPRRRLLASDGRTGGIWQTCPPVRPPGDPSHPCQARCGTGALPATHAACLAQAA